MRNLTDHIVSGDQAVQLQVEATDEPNLATGANHAFYNSLRMAQLRQYRTLNRLLPKVENTVREGTHEK